MQSCYAGPAETEGVGKCKSGTTTCDGKGNWSDCVGQTLPAAETCAQTSDEDCDGHDCVRWAAVFGDANKQQPLDVETDAAGNVYLLGTFEGTIDFTGTPFVSAGATDFFLVKLNPSGQVQWARQYGNAMSQSSAELAVDPAGNVALAGKFSGVLDFGGPAIQDSDMFVARLDTNGKHVWSKGYKATSCSDAHIAATPDGTAMLWLDFLGTADFGGTVLSSGPDRTGALVGLAPADAAVTLQETFAAKGGDVAGGPGNAVYARSLTLDGSGNITLGGYFDGGAIDLGDTDLAAPSGPAEGVGFLARFDKFGSDAWSVLESVNNVVSVNPVGAVARARLAIGAGDGTCFSAEVSTYSSVGVVQWNQSYSCSDTDNEFTGVYVAADAQGNVVLALTLTAMPFNFGGADLPAIGDGDMALLKLDQSGGHLWSRRFGAAGASQQHAIVTTAPNGDIILSAQVEGAAGTGAIDLGTGPLVTKGQDLLIARFAP